MALENELILDIEKCVSLFFLQKIIIVKITTKKFSFAFILGKKPYYD